MAPSILLDFETVQAAASDPVGGVSHVESINPHRGEIRMLDGIATADRETGIYSAWKDIREDAFWVSGHIPGRPLFPGVLMVEAAAQLASYICLTQMDRNAFMGFSGIKSAKFRGQVVPGDRLYLVAKLRELKPRRCTCDAQGLVNGDLVFETTVQGMFF